MGAHEGLQALVVHVPGHDHGRATLTTRSRLPQHRGCPDAASATGCKSFPERIDTLPIRVRPRPGELADSFVCRLARANHIEPSYLHGLVHGPPLWVGAPKIDRLALSSGIPEAVLERTLLNVATSLTARASSSRSCPSRSPSPRC
ncbi:TniQ family protein [Streptomyces ipomoeae]